jgi:hypothetical protein
LSFIPHSNFCIPHSQQRQRDANHPRQHRDNPEPLNNLHLAPPQQFKVVMQWSYLEEPLARACPPPRPLEIASLD